MVIAMLPTVKIPKSGTLYQIVRLQEIADTCVPEPVINNLHTVRIQENAIKFCGLDMYYVMLPVLDQKFESGYYDTSSFDDDNFTAFHNQIGKTVCVIDLMEKK